VRRGIENAERACARLPALPAGSEEQVREAHSLKGTAGTFGLRRVSAVAGEIEAAARDGGDVSGLVGRLARRWRPRARRCASPGCSRTGGNRRPGVSPPLSLGGATS
jgi:HPt (histidine-containing phosphotransfer) domain-containing protein